MNDIVDRICARRSVSPKRLIEPSPSLDELHEMARAAAAAPDHGRLGPARLVHIPNERRDALADVFAAAALEAEPESDTARIEDARQRSQNGAYLIAVIATITEDDPRVPPHEQWISVGAAIQNVLLAAESFGYRAKIVSGAGVTSEAMRSAFALKKSEHLVGFVATGSYDAEPNELPRRPIEEVISVWVLLGSILLKKSPRLAYQPILQHAISRAKRCRNMAPRIGAQRNRFLRFHVSYDCFEFFNSIGHKPTSCSWR